MLWEGALGLVDQPGPASTAVCFLCRRRRRGEWHPVIDLSSLNSYVTLTKFTMEMVSSVLALIRNVDVMFSINLKDTYFQIPIHPNSRLYLRIALQGKINQLRSLCFGLSTVSQAFTSFGIGVGSSEGDLSSSLPGRSVGDCGVDPSHPPTLWATPPALSGPGDCHQLGEVRPWAVQQGSASWSADRYPQREGLPDRLLDYQVLGSCKSDHALLVSWSGLFPGAALWCAHFSGSRRLSGFQLQMIWWCLFPWLRNAWITFAGGFRRRDGGLGFLSKFLLPLFFCTLMLLWLAGERISSIWWWQGFGLRRRRNSSSMFSRWRQWASSECLFGQHSRRVSHTHERQCHSHWSQKKARRHHVKGTVRSSSGDCVVDRDSLSSSNSKVHSQEEHSGGPADSPWPDPSHRMVSSSPGLRVVVWALQLPSYQLACYESKHQGYCAAFNHVFLLAGVDLAASHIICRMFHSFEKSCPPHEVQPQ